MTNQTFEGTTVTQEEYREYRRAQDFATGKIEIGSHGDIRWTGRGDVEGYGATVEVDGCVYFQCSHLHATEEKAMRCAQARREFVVLSAEMAERKMAASA